MAYQLPQLPYAYDALEPHIDAQTMEIHHTKHHQAYINKVNDAIKGTEFENLPVEQLLRQLSSVPENIRTTVRNNGGGHANHSLFWTVMGPGKGGKPSGELAQAIDKKWGSLDKLKEEFNAAAANRFGSGWAWLCLGNGDIHVTSTPNQDSPLSEGHTPLLGLDVWEHAYYLKYQNKRPDYVSAWWNVVNWDEVARRYSEAKKG